jgi:NTP pyrophosphatase (non-canonical NTP hydrolase)
MTLTAGGLAKLLEEIGELGQVCAKKLAYFDTDNHPDANGPLNIRMQDEMGDVIAAMAFVRQKLSLDEQAIMQRATAKLNLFAKWDEDPDNSKESFEAKARHVGYEQGWHAATAFERGRQWAQGNDLVSDAGSQSNLTNSQPARQREMSGG